MLKLSSFCRALPARRLVETAAFWLFVALFVILASAASAGELTDRYEHLVEIGALDREHAGEVVAVEPRDVTLHALARLEAEGRVETEEVAEGQGLLVRFDLGSKGAAWHLVAFAEADDGTPVAVVFFLGLELPNQPA